MEKQKQKQKRLPNFGSSVQEKGNVVSQIVHFKDGTKKTFTGVLTDTIEQSEFTRFDVVDGRRVYIYTPNVNFFEVFDDRE